jgi:Protein of unknown function (DUF499)
VETCEPRRDVLSGGLADNHFAAQLDQVVRNPEAYPVYGDPGEFFALTFPTSGLKRLLARTFGRLSQAKVEAAEHGVIRAETSFGGGKTHSLMAVYHLAKGARPANLADFIDPAMLPAHCQVAAVVADTLDPENGLVTNGIRSYTIWGEIAAQLGPDAYAKLRASDEGRTAPGKATWAEIVGDTPTVIIIDEIAQHLRQLSSSGNPDVRRMASAIPAFLKNLFELAIGTPSVVVIVTLATTADAYGTETNELSALLDELEGGFTTALADTQSVLARSGQVIKPAEDNEIGEILKRRLFASIDAGAVAEAGEAYRAYYEGLLARGEQLGGGAEAPVTYGEAVAASYPFHPELIRVLDKRIGSIALFQRARGALKLLAEVIAGVWARGADTEILNVADIDYGRADVLAHLTIGIGRGDFDGVAKVDFAAGDSHAAVVDATRFAGRAPYATRACRTVFSHSLELVATAGAGRADYLLGTLRVGDEPTVIGEALAAVEAVAWHLFYDGLRWRFLVEPNANKIVAEEMKNIPNTRVNEELEERVRRTFPSDGPVKAIHFPTGPGDVPDQASLRLVVFHHYDIDVTDRTAAVAPDKARLLLDRVGVAEGIRTYRNSLVFLVADQDAREAMRERVRADIAGSTLVHDPSRLEAFSPEVRARIKAVADKAKLEARVAVARCFKHLYIPWLDKANGYLRHVELSPKAQGEADKAQTKVILQALVDDGKVRTQNLATDYLKAKAWPKGAEQVSTQAISEAFWRDHGAQLVLDPTKLRDVIRDGVRNGSWVYYDIQAQRAWQASDPPPPVQLSEEALLYTPAEAERLGLLGREARVEDVLRVFTGLMMTGPELRGGLESVLNREPTKTEIAEVLARAVSAGEASKIVAVAGAVEPGKLACTPAQVRKASLDTITLLTSEEAKKRDIVFGRDVRPVKVVEAKGVAGVAFQALQDKAVEVDSPGFRTLSITAAADTGEGPRDLSLLGKAIAMLPKFDISAELDLALDFKGLSPGVEFTLSGNAADYQRVEDAILTLAKAASAVAGTLRLDLHFEQPCRPDGQEYGRIRRVLADLQPGELRLKGVLA